MNEYVIEMLNITKEFPGIRANDDITLRLRRGEIHALLGENGAGKSTLMSVLFGLYQPEKGTIKKDGEIVHIKGPNEANALNIGMVHQHFKLVEVFTVLENIILGVEPNKFGFLEKKEARKKVVALSERYGLKIDPDALIENISVGMQQRVEILKMLYRDNQNWLDEPATMPPALLGETILALYQLGEFEYAESLQSLLAEDEDRLLTTCIQVTRDDKTVQERRQRYQQLNDLGIKAYQAGELEQALGHFREALRRAPANTGAALNKIQVLLQLMQKNRKSPEFGAECKETLEVLEGIPLNPAQQERFRKLRQEYHQHS